MNRARMAFHAATLSAAVCLTGALAACSSAPRPTTSSTPSPSTRSAAVQLGHVVSGSMQITGGYVPRPASPDVAAAYLTITDSGTAGDTLLAASSPAAASVQLHQTVEHGDTATMQPIVSLPVPAHGSVAFAPSGRHLMLMDPRPLTQGATVPITLRFAKAGAVTVMLPVVGLTGPATGDSMPDDMPGMDDKPGMGSASGRH